jgi:hypothetical protein
MAVLNAYLVRYEIVNLTGQPGAKYLYRSGPQSTHVAAATQAGVAAVLASNTTLRAGESIEVLDIHGAAISVLT